MSEWFSQLQLARPLALLMLMAVPSFWLRWKQRSVGLVVLRSLIFSLLVLALAEPHRVKEVKRTVRQGSSIFAFDLSESIPGEVRRWMEEVARKRVSPTEGDLVLVFGGKSREVKDWEAWLRGNQSLEAIAPERTNLEGLMAKALEHPGAPRSVFLFTDGWETEGRVEGMLSSLSPSTLKIYPFLPTAPLGAANVIVKRILAPHAGESGAGIQLRVAVENQNTRPVSGRMILKRNSEGAKVIPVKINPGRQLLSLGAGLPDGGLSSFEVRFVPQELATDRYLDDNRSTAWVSVRPKEKVLVLNSKTEEGKVLEELLTRMGFQVTSVAAVSSPPDPAKFRGVVFNNAARNRFSSSYLAAISEQVRSGGSLLMLGAEESFGPGGYKGSSIEDALPVLLKEPAEEKKNRAIVLVIDKSGSMRRDKKLVYAKEAAGALAANLLEQDLLGVVGFDVEPFVVVPLATMDRLRDVVGAQVDRLKAGGRTFLFPAIVEARNQLEKVTASAKHVIILSDGETGGTGSDYIDLVSAMRKRFRITVSTVAIGDQANVRLLRRVAHYGGGLYHHTYDPSTLPRIVLSEIKEEPPMGPLVEERELPEFSSTSRIFRNRSRPALPPLQGYVETNVKTGANLDVRVSRAKENIPLVATWDYGKGKSAVFTADLHGRWTKDWIRWHGLEDFWRSLFQYLIPSEDPLPPHEVRINLNDRQVVLDLFLYKEEIGSPVFRFSYQGKGQRGEGTLRRVAAGHYRGALPLWDPGDYRIALLEVTREKEVSYPALGFTLAAAPYAEVRRDHFNTALLERLAQRTGGTINPDRVPATKAEEVRHVSRSYRSLLAVLAGMLFLLETFLRRILTW